MRTWPRLALLLLWTLPAAARAGDPSGEYRLQARSGVVADLLRSRLTVSPAQGGEYHVLREGWPARLEGRGCARQEGDALVLEVEFASGMVSGLEPGRRLSGAWTIWPATGRIEGELRQREPSGRVRAMREAGRKRSGYLLPWPAGHVHTCVQGNAGFVSHMKGAWDEHSFDFAMPVGSPVCAARDGVVTRVDVSHHGQGKRKPANVIYVRHDDGTTASYVHLMKGGSLVALGDRVRQGQVIGRSGNVGPSLLPHLHFMVEGRDGRSIRVWFDEVPNRSGVPRTLGLYVSANAVR